LKFKIDENLPVECALVFREAGFDAATVADQQLSGADDSVLFELCCAENRVLVTLTWISQTSRHILPVRIPGF
jgi:predicted nuclease of predicted toxin-antitoxin system